MPKRYVDKRPRPGLKLYCFGGATGADGLRGAVMSSRDLRSSDFRGSAVQVASAFVQRCLTDFLMDARDRGLLDVVTDNGAGLSEDEIAKIFDPFFTTKNRSDQLGLGLYVVASIVDRHKGHISVESNPGRRTAFTVTFPMAV